MGDIKVRSDFLSDTKGIDSNTISAGEDNLFMLLTALVSLKYYFQSIESKNEVESILLVDELDATLHPSYQYKLLERFRSYANKYKIQVIFTTHSLSLIEFALEKKDNVIYLLDNITSVHQIEAPDIYKIRMYLHDKTRDDIYLSKTIPIFTEDAEARLFLDKLFDYYETTFPCFSKVRRFFHFVDANIGATNLINIFRDSYLLRSTMRSICILDGDQQVQQDLDKYIVVLPGKDSPEKFIMEYSKLLYNNDDPFWTHKTILDLNYGKAHYLSRRKPDIDSIEIKLKDLQNSGKSCHGEERRLRKKVFNDHRDFFGILFIHWVNNPINREQVDKFYHNLFCLFRKVAEFHGINPGEWYLQDSANEQYHGHQSTFDAGVIMCQQQ